MNANRSPFPVAVPLLAVVFLPCSLLGTGLNQPATLDRKQAKEAFNYLNKIRSDPPAFAKELGVAELKDVKPIHVLKWNDALAKVAEAKAIDMATRNYFAHVDPDGFGTNIKMHEAGYTLNKLFLMTKDQNNFESIFAGAPSGIQIISTLIIDKNAENLGHRQHLLGLSGSRAKHRDIGIGVASNPASKYKHYACVLIAHH
jgi:uncharacterized protein YkwD